MQGFSMWIFCPHQQMVLHIIREYLVKLGVIPNSKLTVDAWSLCII